MKVVEINIYHAGSTGKIMLQIASTARRKGHLVKTCSPARFLRGNKTDMPFIEDHTYWGSKSEFYVHNYVGMLLGRNGTFSHRGTRKLIRELKNFNPDIIHLHNIHAFCINLPMLFGYIKKNNIKVIWTLHDCWAFTGHCAHFAFAKCDKWKTRCHHCPQPRVYPKMYLDTSKKMYELKRKWFCGIENMTIVTPSQWLCNLVKESFLKNYPVKVINNGIDLSIFKPTESGFRSKYGCEDKKILVGVASTWGAGKGLDVFLELAKRLDDGYRIVLVGLDKNYVSNIPENVIAIKRTENQQQLAEIYTTADLFVNPTREDTYPTVNIEALACGTPILTFKTGGSPEIIDETCGSVVDVDDISTMEREIIRILKDKPYSKEACLKKAKTFDMNDRFEEYVELYEEVNER